MVFAKSHLHRTEPHMLQGHRDLKVYQLAYDLAMEIFRFVEEISERGNIFSDRPDSPIISKRRCQYSRRISQTKVSEPFRQQAHRLRRRGDREASLGRFRFRLRISIA